MGRGRAAQEVGLPRSSVLPRVRASRRRRVGAHGCDALRPCLDRRARPSRYNGQRFAFERCPAPGADLPLALRRPRRPVADGSFGRAIHIKTSLVRLASSLSGSVSRCASLCKGYCCAFALVRLFIRSPALSLCRRWCSQRQKICAWVALRGALAIAALRSVNDEQRCDGARRQPRAKS